MVKDLAKDICKDYQKPRQNCQEEVWPPIQPAIITTVALIHYGKGQMQKESFDICFKDGAPAVDKIVSSHSRVTKDICAIFNIDPASANVDVPKRILIEGAPGIGKTVLAKNIACFWANGKLLKECKLLFLVYLRDPKVHEVKSIKDLLNLFKFDDIPKDLEKYVKHSRGKYVGFVFDGFDEYPSELQSDSFIANIIKGKGMHDGKMFQESTIVVTSRPTATLDLHDVVDRRIQILGFAKEERDEFISLSLGNVLDEQNLDKYLNQHSIINSLCFIPLHLSVLLFLYQINCLPETLTEMNELFIIHTIYRQLCKLKLLGETTVKKISDFREPVSSCIQKLSAVAFNGLENNKLVFSHAEIKSIYSPVDDTEGAINGFGLLQSVQHYNKKGVGKTTSLNFLHFTMQEYLAALHVSTLPSEDQLSLIKKTFWEGKFMYMWMMYVGIVGVNSDPFVSFTRDLFKENNKTNKLRRLHLLLCYMESKALKIPESISSVFSNGIIDFNGTDLLPHQISALVLFMSASTTQKWRYLDLGRSYLGGKIGMENLLEHFIKNKDNLATLEYVDLSEYDVSPWSVYCIILRHSCVGSLTLFGDKGMKEYAEQITGGLNANKMLYSLTLYSIGRNGAESLEKILINNITLKELNVAAEKISDSTKDSKVYKFVIQRRCGSVKYNVQLSDKKPVYHTKSIHRSISMNSDVMSLIKLGLDNDCTLQEFDISDTTISPDGVRVFGNTLKNNTSLQKLDISQNTYDANKVNMLSNYLRKNVTLKELNISNSEMEDVGVKKVFKALQANEDSSIQKLNMSGNCLSLSAIVVISISLKVNYSIKEMIMMNVKLTDEGMQFISESIRSNCSLCTLDVSRNWISAKGLLKSLDLIKNNATLQLLVVTYNNISQSDLTTIYDLICANAMPVKLHASWNEIVYYSPWDAIEKDYSIFQVYYFINSVFCILCKSFIQDQCCFSGKSKEAWSLSTISDPDIRSEFYGGCFKKEDTVHNLITSFCFNQEMVLPIVDVVAESSEKEDSLTIDKMQIEINQMSKDHCRITIKCGAFKYVNHYFNALIISSLLYKNNLVRELDFSCHNVTDDGAKAISFSLKNNFTLLQLNLSNNKIAYKGAVNILDSIKKSMVLKRLDLLHNLISSQDIPVIINSIQEYDICINFYNDNGASLKIVDFSSQVFKFSLSWSTKDHEFKVLLNVNMSWTTLLECLHKCSNNITVLCVCHMDISDVKPFGDYLKSNTTLKELDLSHNKITCTGIMILAEAIKINSLLNVLNVSYNIISEAGLLNFLETIQTNSSLLILKALHNIIGKTGLNNITHFITYNNLSLYVFLSWDKLILSSDKGLLTVVIRSKTIICQTTCVYIESCYDNHEWYLFDPKYRAMIFDNFCRECNATHLLNKQFGSNFDVNLFTFTKIIVQIVDLFLVRIDSTFFLRLSCTIDHNTYSAYYTICESRSRESDNVGYFCALFAYIILHHNTPIKELKISDCKLFDDGAMIIGNCLKVNNVLHKLDLSCNKIGSAGATIIARSIESNVVLQTLDISHNQISDIGAIAISNCLKSNKVLLELDISGNEISDEAVEAISEYFYINGSIKKLDISKNWISVEGVLCILNSIKEKSTLKQLAVTHNNINKSDLQLISKFVITNCMQLVVYSSWNELVANFDTIKTICCLCTNTGVHLIKQNPDKLLWPLTFVSDINYKKAFFDNFLKEIGNSVQSLEISASITSDVVQSIQSSVKGLKILTCCENSFSNQNFCTDSAVKITEVTKILKTNVSLQKIDFSHNEISEIELEIVIGGLKCINMLQYLNLSNCAMYDYGMIDIVEALRDNKTLQTLDVSNNYISDDGAVAISNLLRNNNVLHKLCISSNEITDYGIIEIACALKCNKALQKLDISCNKIFEDGTIAIMDCLRFNSILKKLFVTSHELSYEGILEVTDILRDENVALQSFDIVYKSGTMTYRVTVIDCQNDHTALEEMNYLYSRKFTNVFKSRLGTSPKRLILISQGYNDDEFMFSLPQQLTNFVKKTVYSSRKRKKRESENWQMSEEQLTHFNLFLEAVQTDSVLPVNITFVGIFIETEKIAISKCMRFHGIVDITMPSHLFSNNQPLFQFIQLHSNLNSLTLVFFHEHYSSADKMDNAISTISSFVKDISVLEELNLLEIWMQAAWLIKITEAIKANRYLQKVTCNGFDNDFKFEVNFSLNSINVAGDCNLTKIPVSVLLNKNQITQLKLSLADCYASNNSSIFTICDILKHSVVLQKLNLSNNNITNNGAAALAKLLQTNSSILQLDISRNLISFQGIMLLLNEIKLNGTLQRLFVQYNNITKCGFREISYFIAKSNIPLNMYASINTFTSGEQKRGMIKTKCYMCTDNLVNNIDNDEEPWSLAEISDLNYRRAFLFSCMLETTSIKELYLSRNCISDVEISAISECIMYSKLKSSLQKLYLSESLKLLTKRKVVKMEGDDDFEIYCDDFETNCVSSSRISNIGAAALSNCLKHRCALKELYLSDNHIESEGAVKIGQALRFNFMLQVLDISCNHISNDGAAAIGDCLKCNIALIKVNVSHNYISCEGIRVIAEALQVNCTLQFLDISRNDLQIDTLVFITESLKMNIALKRFVMSFTNKTVKLSRHPLSYEICKECVCSCTNNSPPWLFFKDDTGTEVKALLPFFALLHNDTKVKVLTISSVDLSDSETTTISECLKNHATLEELDLSRNNITDKGAKIISSTIQSNKSLIKLDLSYNALTVAGVFCFLKEKSFLLILKVTYNCIGKTEVKAISKYICWHKLSLRVCVSWSTVILLNKNEFVCSERTTECICDSLAVTPIHHENAAIMELCSAPLCLLKSLRELNTWEKLSKSLDTLSNKHIWNSSAAVKIVFSTLCKIYSTYKSGAYERKEHFRNCFILSHIITATTTTLFCSPPMDYEVCRALLMSILLFRVKMLDISHNQITTNDAKIISINLSGNQTLQHLDISHNKIHDDALMVIAKHLEFNTVLEELNVSENRITCKGLKKLGECMQENKSLVKLNVSKNLISMAGLLDFLQKIKTNNNLQDLIATHNNINKTELTILCSYIVSNKISLRVHASWNTFRYKASNILESEIKTIFHECHAKISNSKDQDYKSNTWSLKKIPTLNDRIAFVQSCLKESTTIKVVELKYCHIETNKLSDILTSITDLQKLDVSCNGLCDDGVKVVSEYLMNSSTLLELDLSRNNITKIGARSIAEAIECNTKLKKIDISFNERIWDDGAIAICDALYNNVTLKELKLSGIDITWIGAKKIAETVSCTQITLLDVSSNELRDKGVIAIAKCVNVSNLRILDVSNNNVSTEMVIFEIYRLLENSNLLQKFIISCANSLNHEIALELNDFSISKAFLIPRYIHPYYCSIEDNFLSAVVQYSTCENLTILNSNASENMGFKYVCKSTVVLSGLSTLSMPILLHGNRGNHLFEKKYKRLKFRACNISEEFADIIAEFLNYRLIEFSLTDCEISCDAAMNRFKSALLTNKTLTKLDLSSNNLRDDGVKAICTALNGNNTLKRLNVSSNNITCAGIQKVAEYIQENKSITRLDISHNWISSNGLLCFLNMIKSNVTLRVLVATHNDINRNGFKDISLYISQNKMDSLKVYCSWNRLAENHSSHQSHIVEIIITFVTCTSMCVVKGGPGNQKVETMDLNKISDHNYHLSFLATCLQECERVQNLEVVSITNFGVKKIAETLSISPKLLVLKIDCSTISDDGAASLSESLNHNSTLQELAVTESTISCKGVQLLANMLSLKISLVKLTLSSNKISCFGAEAIAYCLQNNTSLQMLDISDNMITDDGAAAISKCLNSTALQELDVSQNHIFDEGAIAIFESVKQNIRLKKVCISHNNITDGGAIFIANVIKNHVSLKKLDISENKLSMSGAKFFRNDGKIAYIV